MLFALSIFRFICFLGFCCGQTTRARRCCRLYSGMHRSAWCIAVGVIVLSQALLSLNISASFLRDLTSYTLAYAAQNDTRGRSNKKTISQTSSATNKKSLSQKLGNYNNTLSICLLTKDDTHTLPEWLAYHYHVSNLRTLIVMVDPTSKTRPIEIFDRFRSVLDIEILEWSDKDIMPENRLNSQGILDADKVADYRRQHLKPIKNKWLRDQVTRKYLPENATEQEIQDTMKRVAVHRYRQEYMATECVNLLREAGRSWVSLLDTDEYIQIGNRNYFDDDAVPGMYEPGAIMKWINTMYSNETACFKMPWTRYGATKVAEETLSQPAPAGFDVKQFMTLQWRFHNGAENNGKDCLNLQRVKGEHFPIKKITNVHVLADPICGSSYTNMKNNPVVIGHYTGMNCETSMYVLYLLFALTLRRVFVYRHLGTVLSTRGCPAFKYKTGACLSGCHRILFL